MTYTPGCANNYTVTTETQDSLQDSTLLTQPVAASKEHDLNSETKPATTDDHDLETDDHDLEYYLERFRIPKKREFLEAYPGIRRVSETAQAVGIAENTVWTWLHRDKEFRKAWELTYVLVSERRRMLYEAELERRALEGKSKMADVLLMFSIKGEDPNKYREKPVQQQIIGNLVVKTDIPRPAYPGDAPPQALPPMKKPALQIEDKPKPDTK